MPRKFNFKPKPRHDAHIYAYKKMQGKYPYNKSKSTTAMVNKSQLRDHTIVADKYYTKISCSFVGKIPAGGSIGSYFTIYANSIYQPLNTANPYTGFITNTDGSSATAPPIGYTALSSLYASYRVKSSRIKVSVNPTNSGDTSLIVITPVQAPFSGTSSYQIMNQRYAKWKMVSSGNNVKENTIIQYMKSSKALGLSDRQFEDQLPVGIASAPPTALDWYWEVDYAQASASASTAGIILITLEVDYYVEFSDPINLTT